MDMFNMSICFQFKINFKNNVYVQQKTPILNAQFRGFKKFIHPNIYNSKSVI